MKALLLILGMVYCLHDNGPSKVVQKPANSSLAVVQHRDNTTLNATGVSQTQLEADRMVQKAMEEYQKTQNALANLSK